MKIWKYTKVPNHNKTADLPLIQMGNGSWAQFYGIDREENAELARAAPDMLEQLQRIRGWLYNDLLRQEAMSKDSAAKAYHEIEALLKTIEG